jgi:predicted nucleotide-binding protein
MHGCDFGIGVLTNLDTAETMTEELRKKYGFNPNLLIECGYMYGLNKYICLLKEEKVTNLPSDWAGLIWNPFNSDNLDSLKAPLEKWLRSFGYIK